MGISNTFIDLKNLQNSIILNTPSIPHLITLLHWMFSYSNVVLETKDSYHSLIIIRFVNI